jgi:indolepyruvate ferredoxin oxidoreductase alpha subunit
LALALGGFGQVFAVPGYPVSHVLDEMLAAGIAPVWSAGEKNAVESAVGSALSGVPSAVVIKHNGLGVALDSLANAVVHGISSPLVVIVGDDVDARSSTSSVDSRVLAAAVGMLMFVPSLARDVGDVLELAAIASARIGAPTGVRITGRLHDRCKDFGYRSNDRARPVPSAGLETGHAHTLNKLSRLVRADALRHAVRAELHETSLDTVSCTEPHGPLLVAVGDVELPALDNACVAVIRGDSPGPRVRAAVAAHDPVVVVEEGEPIVERALGTVRGRRSGHLPRIGRLTPPMVMAAIADEATPDPLLAERLADLPSANDALFVAIARHRAEGAFVATDVGSSVALSYPPYSGADSALALGSSTAVAAGAARSGRSAIAVLGDFGLLHSGLTGLVEIAAAALPVVTVILENGVQEKTGGQPLPLADLGALLGGAVGRVEVWVDPGWDAETLYAALARELGAAEPVVVRYQRHP